MSAGAGPITTVSGTAPCRVPSPAGLSCRSAICHETDHLDGHLYVEKVEGDLMSTDDYYADLEDAEWEEE